MYRLHIYLNILVSKLEMAVSEVFMPVRQAERREVPPPECR